MTDYRKSNDRTSVTTSASNRPVHGLTLPCTKHSVEYPKGLNTEARLRKKSSQLGWFDHVTRMHQDTLAS